MGAFLPNNKDRNVIPRWRDFNQTQNLGELNSLLLPHISLRKFSAESLLKHETKIGGWKEHRDIENAIELINSSYILDDYDNAKDAANFIINSAENIPLSLKAMSEKIITGDIGITSNTAPTGFSQLNELISNLIRNLRVKLQLNPYNSINWIEIARLYLIIGKTNEAERCILVSLRLSPNNRYVSRISSRFFIHIGDHLKAKKILKTNINFLRDPWLIGADIAISTMQHKSSNNIKKGFTILDSKNLSPFDTNELASALATEEMFSGNNKNSKKLFNKSLINPNDNSIAQAVWASTKVGILDLNNAKVERTPNNFEAKAYSYFNENDWEHSLSSTLQWFIDQPFSRDPAIFGSFIASSALTKYETAIEIAKFGLRATPNEFYLLNNLAFSYLMMKNAIDAEIVIAKISIGSLNERQRIIYLATHGLLQYAKNDVEGGKKYYNEAIDLADKLKDYKLKLTAEMYHIRAKLLFKIDAPTSLLPMLDKLEVELKKLNVPYLITVMNNLRLSLNSLKAE